MEFSLENMCRACMNEEGSMYSVYDKEKNPHININYSDMIMTFASVQVITKPTIIQNYINYIFGTFQIEIEDALPKKICQYCLKQLILAYTFKETIERCDATLREITKNPGIEFIKEEIIDNDDFSQGDQPEEESNFDFETLETEPNDKGDFKLTAEFLDDDFHVLEDENDFADHTEEPDENIKIDAVKPVIKNNFKPSIEQLKESVLKPKSRRKITANSRLYRDTDEYLPVQVSKHAKQYICPLCNKRFAKFDTFKKHKKLHKTLKCNLCEKEFRSTHGLRYHMKVHSGVKNYACTFENCDKKFRLKQALDKHLSIHNNEKNHLCPICGKTYAQYDALHYHIRNHTGERPYLCVHCGKTFKQSCHLKNHMWNHTGIKPHKCKSCGKCYTTGHQLKKHLRKYCNNPANQNMVNTVKDEVNEIVHFKIEDEHILEMEVTEDQDETENATKMIYLKQELRYNLYLIIIIIVIS